MVSRNTIKVWLLIAVVFYLCFRSTFELFDYYEGDFKRDLMIIFIILVANHYFEKETMKDQKELNRVEQSISKNGLIKHHAKEIINTYGDDYFVGLTFGQIENVVTEYDELFSLNLEGNILLIAGEIETLINNKNDI